MMMSIVPWPKADMVVSSLPRQTEEGVLKYPMLVKKDGSSHNVFGVVPES